VFKVENEPGIKLGQRMATRILMVNDLYAFKDLADCSLQYQAMMMSLYRSTLSLQAIVRVHKKMLGFFSF